MKNARLVCYAPDSQLPQAPADLEDRKFTQDDLNKILAEDRRKHQAQVVKIQSTLEETLTSKNLTTQERDSLAAQLDEVKNSFKTVEERKASELRDREKALEAAKKEAAEWKARHDNLTIEQQLSAAAVGNDGFNPSQLVELLRPKTELKPVNGPDGGLRVVFHTHDLAVFVLLLKHYDNARLTGEFTVRPIDRFQFSFRSKQLNQL